MVRYDNHGAGDTLRSHGHKVVVNGGDRENCSDEGDRESYSDSLYVITGQ